MEKKYTVTLDAGHGGHDPGAVNRKHNLEEADMALDVVLRAGRMLADYVNVVYTRTDDTFITLSQRPAISNRANADVFVSYHFNSASSPNTDSSWEIYTTPGQNRSDRLADCIGKHHAAFFPDQAGRSDMRDGDIDKEANFAVIRRTDHPSVLMEGEFIHTDHGAALIAKPVNRQLMAQAVVLGVLDYLGIDRDSGKQGALEYWHGFEVEESLTIEERLSRIEQLCHITQRG